MSAESVLKKIDNNDFDFRSEMLGVKVGQFLDRGKTDKEKSKKNCSC